MVPAGMALCQPPSMSGREAASRCSFAKRVMHQRTQAKRESQLPAQGSSASEQTTRRSSACTQRPRRLQTSENRYSSAQEAPVTALRP